VLSKLFAFRDRALFVPRECRNGGACVESRSDKTTDRQANLNDDASRQNKIQEQIQTIAAAIGKPAAKAPTTVSVNAANRFASGRS